MFTCSSTVPSPTTNYFQQQAAYNPFAQQQGLTNQPFAVPQIQTQQTGFVVPQHTAFNPFGLQQQPQPQPQGFGSSLQPQPSGFLVPQATGANPFRQSALFPQATGVTGPPFIQQQQQPPPQFQAPAQTGALNPFPGSGNGFGGQPFGSTNPFPGSQQQPQQPTTNPFPNVGAGASLFANLSSQQSPSGPFNPFPSFTSGSQPTVASPLTQPASSNAPSNAPPRPASVPLSGAPSEPTSLRTHQTGSRNPFGVPVAPAPPVPKVPTLMELAFGTTNGAQHPHPNGSTSPTGLKPHTTGFGAAGGANGSVIANVASEFAFSSGANTQNATPGVNTSFSLSSLQRSTSPTATGSPATSASFFSSLSSQPTGASSASSPASPLQPQTTGYGGLKAFKPSSSFGAALLESLPPIPQSAPTTPNLDSNKHAPMASLGSSPLLNSQPTGFGGGTGLGTGSTVGVGLRPQATGLAGAANPFRATMFSLSPGGSANAFGGGLTSNPTGNAFGSGSIGGLGPTNTGFPGQYGVGAGNAFGGPFGVSASAPNALNPQQQQNGQTSLI